MNKKALVLSLLCSGAAGMQAISMPSISLKDMGNKISAQCAHLKENVIKSEVAKTVTTFVNDKATATNEFVKANPYKAAGIAAGVGSVAVTYMTYKLVKRYYKKQIERLQAKTTRRS